LKGSETGIEEKPPIYQFDEFRLDALKRQLTRDGEVVPLYSKAFDLLLVLVQSGGRDVSKDELLEQVWPGQILEESNLPVNISAVRRALGEKAAQPRYIVTVPGRGYRFVGNVQGAGREAQAFVIESQTISRVTTVEETDEVSDAANAARPGQILIDDGSASVIEAENGRRTLGPAPAVTTGAARGLLRRPVMLALLVVALVLGLVVVFTLRWRLSRPRITTASFHQIKLRQLTNDGGVVLLAISPDGKLFAFIHAERTGGNESLRLGRTNGEAPIVLHSAGRAYFYKGVEFAPDGSSLYYSTIEPSRNTLYRIPVLGGLPVKVRDNISLQFSISPDNKRLAFFRTDAASHTSKVVISNLDGSNERVVLNVPLSRTQDAAGISWSPDGSMIALAMNPENDQAAAGIFLLQVASGELRPLTGATWREISRLAWLKDGSGILATAASPGHLENRQIWLAACPGGEVHRITNDLNSYDIGLSVSSDSNYLLTTEFQQMNNIWLAPADDLIRAKQLTFGALNRFDGAAGLDWTPDGRIVYVSAIDQSRTLWLMNADGTNPRELTPPGSIDNTPSVTGDGRFIVFDSIRGGASEIWRINIDGSEPKQLTTCGKNSEPSASPDGKWVVFKSGCDAVGSLYRVSINGGEPMRLTKQAAGWPWVSPDSEWIACEYLGDEGRMQLAIIPIKGGPPQKLFDVPPLTNFRWSIRWTADGKAITYRDWGKGIWRQSITGGAPEQLRGLPEEKFYSNSWSRDGKLFAFTRGAEIRDAVLISNSQ